MKLGIFGAIALGLGVWALVYWRWIVVEVFHGLIALGLIMGGVLAIAIALRKMYKAKKQTG